MMEPSKVSRIGIFWIQPNGDLISEMIKWTELPATKLQWLNYSDHYHFWEKYSQKLGITFDYVTYPRGRIMFNPQTQTSKILASKSVLANKQVIAKVVTAFELNKFITEPDEHYEKALELLSLRDDEEIL